MISFISAVLLVFTGCAHDQASPSAQHAVPALATPRLPGVPSADVPSHSTPPEQESGTVATRDQVLHLECVVEEYEPESHVIYGIFADGQDDAVSRVLSQAYAQDWLPYDAISRVSTVRILAPVALAGRRFCIDLRPHGEDRDQAWQDLRQPGEVVRFFMYSTWLPADERGLVPVYVIEREANQPAELTALAPTGIDSRARSLSLAARLAHG